MRAWLRWAVTVLACCYAGCAPQAKNESVPTQRKPFLNLADGKTYSADWRTYNPDTPRQDEPGQKVKAGLVRLITSEDEIAARTTAQEVSAFLLEAERLATATFEKSQKPFQLLVQFTCKPTGFDIKMASQGDAPKDLLQAYYDALTAAKRLPVKGGEVSFQLELSVSP